MPKVVNSEPPSQKRKRLLKLVIESARVLQNSDIDADDRNDIIAFILLTLKEVEKTIIQSVIPWEKRGYWVKADKFRDDWKWIGEIKNQISTMRTRNGWKQNPEKIFMIFDKFNNIQTPKGKPSEEFWKGAFLYLQKSELI